MKYDPGLFRGDLTGGLTSAVVSLPFALAFGIASGMGAAAGMYGAIAVGLFASVFGGTRTVVSGPAPSVTIAMAVIVTSQVSTLSEALFVVLLAGALQVVLGLSRLGRYVVYTPHVVVSGFMSGIGIIIILMQALPFLGAPVAPGGTISVIRSLLDAVNDVNLHALAIAAVTLVVAVFWPRALGQYIPAPLLALLVGTITGAYWLSGAPVVGEIPAGLPVPRFELPSWSFLIHAVQPALIIALLGSVDSLLACLIADSLTGSRHNPDRELAGQGIGNMAAGLIGGLPGSGATVSTVTNIRSGGQTPVSGVIRTLVLMMILLGLGRFVEQVPHAVLAGILMVVGWNIIDWRLLSRIRHLRREHLFVMILTLSLTVFVDLITAVAIGLIAAGMVHARQLETLELDSVISVPLLDRELLSREEIRSDADPHAARVGLVSLRGSFTIASSRKLVETIGEDIKEHEVVIFDFSDALYVDDSAALVMERLLAVAEEQETRTIVMGLSGSVSNTLAAFEVLRRVPEWCQVGSMEQARSAAAVLLRSKGSVGPTDDRS